MSDFNNFIFNENDWIVGRRENEGALENKVWLISKTDKSVRALFKPDGDTPVGIQSKSQREYESARIAGYLNIPHAQIEIIKYKGQIGAFSFNTKTANESQYKNMFVFAADNNLHDEHYNPALMIGSISLQTIKKKYPQIEKEVVDMLFLDCFVKNWDRHGGNWEFLCGESDRPVSLCPVFDFDHALEPYSDAPDLVDSMCAVLYTDKSRLEKQTDIFKKLCVDYPLQIKSLLDKTNTIPDLNEIAAHQLAQMNEIYTKTLETEQSAALSLGDELRRAITAKAARPKPLDRARIWLTEKFAPPKIHTEATKQNLSDSPDF